MLILNLAVKQVANLNQGRWCFSPDDFLEEDAYTWHMDETLNTD